MKIISHDDYTLIRNYLYSKNPKTVKSGIQEMLNLLECGLVFPKIDKIRLMDFHSILFEILKYNDFDIRKWTYHLLCVYSDPIDISRLINAAISNIEIESQQSIENISWIVAFCGAHSKSKCVFDEYLVKGSITDYLSKTQIELASAAFREYPFYDISNKFIMDAINPNDFISPIWITKIYANQFKYFKDSSCYYNNHGGISNDILADLLNHPNEVVRKYSMWAFAQDTSSWHTPVRLENTFNLESGMLKWHLVNLFQNDMFIKSNSDFIEEISRRIRDMTVADKEGVILGCKKLGYSEQISELLIDWSQSTWETNENLLVNLYSYFAKFSNENTDYFELTKSAINNMDHLPPSLQNFYRNFKKQNSEKILWKNKTTIIMETPR